MNPDEMTEAEILTEIYRIIEADDVRQAMVIAGASKEAIRKAVYQADAVAPLSMAEFAEMLTDDPNLDYVGGQAVPSALDHVSAVDGNVLTVDFPRKR